MKLHDQPSVRLVLPLIGGILLSDTIENSANAALFLCALILAFFLVICILPVWGERSSRLFGVLASACFLVTGFVSYSWKISRSHVDWPENSALYSGTLLDYPQEKPKSYRLDVLLDGNPGQHCKVIVYVPKEPGITELEAGQQVMFQCNMRAPENGDSLTFDYAAYLYRHGWSGTAWVNHGKFIPGAVPERVGYRAATARIRNRLVAKYREWGMEGEVLSVISAVTLGYKRDLDGELKEKYSASGASHVLAVSGLHVGIMGAFLYLLFPVFRRRPALRWLREVIVMGLMWTYAAVIGFPLSITRSLIMFTMVAVCRITERNTSSVNTLAFAALIILCMDPAALFDMSFQLSFSAVLSILVLEPPLAALVETEGKVQTYLRDLIAVSLAAQLGTAPIIISQFSTFSTYFLLTNLLMIPLMFVVVSLCVVLWMVSPLSILRSCVVWVISLLVRSGNRSLDFIVNLPLSVLEINTGSGMWLICYYSILLFVYAWLREQRTHRLVQLAWIGAALSIWALLNIVLK